MYSVHVQYTCTVLVREISNHIKHFFVYFISINVALVNTVNTATAYFVNLISVNV